MSTTLNISNQIQINTVFTVCCASTNPDPDLAKKAIITINKECQWDRYTPLIINKLEQNPECILIAFQNRKVVGYSMLCPEKQRLGYIATACEVRRQGLGLTLMEATLDKAYHLGLKTLSWHFRGNKESTCKFYDSFLMRHPFSYEKKQAGNYLNGDPKIEIVIDLSASLLHQKAASESY